LIRERAAAFSALSGRTRGFALMSQRWRILQSVMLSPGKIGDIAKAALVLVHFEHKCSPESR